VEGKGRQGWEGKFRGQGGREGKGVGKRGGEGKFRGGGRPPKFFFPRTMPAIKHGNCADTTSTPFSLCDEADQRLFAIIAINNTHSLHTLQKYRKTTLCIPAVTVLNFYVKKYT